MTQRQCSDCGTSFYARAYNAKRCDPCRAEARRYKSLSENRADIRAGEAIGWHPKPRDLKEQRECRAAVGLWRGEPSVRFECRTIAEAEALAKETRNADV